MYIFSRIESCNIIGKENEKTDKMQIDLFYSSSSVDWFVEEFWVIWSFCQISANASSKWMWSNCRLQRNHFQDGSVWSFSFKLDNSWMRDFIAVSLERFLFLVFCLPTNDMVYILIFVTNIVIAFYGKTLRFFQHLL